MNEVTPNFSACMLLTGESFFHPVKSLMVTKLSGLISYTIRIKKAPKSWAFGKSELSITEAFCMAASNGPKLVLIIENGDGPKRVVS